MSTQRPTFKPEIIQAAADSERAVEFYQPGSMPEIFQSIELLSKKLKQLQSQTLRLTHLTPPQFFILTLLWRADGRPFKDLAKAMTCSRATITGIVDTLERKELVYRAPHPSDRRSQLVQLTQAGRDMQSSTPNLERMFNCCCTGLDPQESQELSRLLKKLDSSLGIRGDEG
jgi:DNA-binding MarR family transcriptional regulator